VKPDIPAVLAELAGLVARNAVPDVDPAERAGALSLSAALLGMAAEAWDGAAQRLVEENKALRALLSDAGDRAGRNAWLSQGIRRPGRPGAGDPNLGGVAPVHRAAPDVRRSGLIRIRPGAIDNPPPLGFLVRPAISRGPALARALHANTGHPYWPKT